MEWLGHRDGEVEGLLVWPEDGDTEGQSLMKLGMWEGTMNRRKGTTLANSLRLVTSPGGGGSELSQDKVCQTPARWKQIRVLIPAQVEVAVREEPWDR